MLPSNFSCIAQTFMVFVSAGLDRAVDLAPGTYQLEGAQGTKLTPDGGSLDWYAATGTVEIEQVFPITIATVNVTPNTGDPTAPLGTIQATINTPWCGVGGL